MAIKNAFCLFENEKMLYYTIRTSDIVEIAIKADPAKDVIAVLVSGDVGFFSLAKTISANCRNANVYVM
ncbi:MAG: hypothetical protein ACLT4X_03125 [Phascolarctobacterium sp.]